MVKNKDLQVSDVYYAPECLVLAIEGQEICETSFNGGEIQPGEGSDWGTL